MEHYFLYRGNNMVRAGAATLLACILAGCATHYQSNDGSLTGGHSNTKGPGNLISVKFYANAYTSPDVTRKYALYRCAEVAHANNKPFFIMYDSLLAAAMQAPSSMPRVGQVQGKPTASAFILLLDSPRPGVHDTEATLQDMRPFIETGKEQKS